MLNLKRNFKEGYKDRDMSMEWEGMKH